MSAPTPADVASAIATIEECQSIHAEWVGFLRSGRPWTPTADDVGGEEWHQEWVEKYARVLRVLRAVDEVAPLVEDLTRQVDGLAMRLARLEEFAA